VKAGTRAVFRQHGGQSDEIIRLKEAGVAPTEIAIRLGIGRASVYRVLCEQETVVA
jgi:DNA invertase Pin-like site-specific DNA recombinase